MAVGVDVRKRTQTFVAVGEVGRKLGETAIPATAPGQHEAMLWVPTEFGSEVRWGVEDRRHLSAWLKRNLARGQRMGRFPPKLVTQTRAPAGTRGESDLPYGPYDELAVAPAKLLEPALPDASDDEFSRKVKLLVDHRQSLVQQRTSAINLLLWRALLRDLAQALRAGSLDRAQHRQQLGAWLATQPGLVDERAYMIRPTKQVNALATRMVSAYPLAPALLSTSGYGELTAARVTRLIRTGAWPDTAARHRWRIGNLHTGAHGPVRQPPTQRRALQCIGRHANPSRRPQMDLLPRPSRRRKLHHPGPVHSLTTHGSRRTRTFAHPAQQPSLLLLIATTNSNGLTKENP